MGTEQHFQQALVKSFAIFESEVFPEILMFYYLCHFCCVYSACYISMYLHARDGGLDHVYLICNANRSKSTVGTIPKSNREILQTIMIPKLYIFLA